MTMLTKYWVDLHGNFLKNYPGIEAKPREVYLAADVEGVLNEIRHYLQMHPCAKDGEACKDKQRLLARLEGK